MKLGVALALVMLAPVASAQEFVQIPAGEFSSSVASEAGLAGRVESFLMLRRPVSSEEFDIFTQSSPQWQRGNAPGLFTDGRYLLDNKTGVRTQVSWFAAQAFCQSIGASLPSWQQWEYVAAASDSAKDAREDTIWQQRWSQDGTPHAADAAQDNPNVYGVHQMHGAHWEWVGDFAGLFYSSGRQGKEDNAAKFCGNGASVLQNRREYSTYQRVAVLSGLTPRSTLDNLGFRCAREP